MYQTDTPEKTRRSKALRTARNIIISVIVLLVLFLGAGTAYVLYTGRKGPEQQKPETTSTNSEIKDLPKPKSPNPKAAVGAYIESLNTPVKAGLNSAVNVHTTPTAKCKIQVVYNDKPSTDSGLVAKTADAYGFVSWTWTVPESTPIGIWPVKITCTAFGKSGYVQGDLKVTN